MKAMLVEDAKEDGFSSKDADSWASSKRISRHKLAHMERQVTVPRAQISTTESTPATAQQAFSVKDVGLKREPQCRGCRELGLEGVATGMWTRETRSPV